MTSRGEAFADSHEESETPVDVNPGFHRGDIQLTPSVPDAPHDPDCARCPTLDARCDTLEAELSAERARNDVLLDALSTFARQKVGDEKIDFAAEVRTALQAKPYDVHSSRLPSDRREDLMVVVQSQSHTFPPDVWEQPEMRAALASREISAVYRLLRKHGVSQRQIAAMTGQSQSEASETLKGRQVMATDELKQIADGLGIPRGYMGLAYDEATAIRIVGQEIQSEEAAARRRFLAHAAQVTMSAAVFGPGSVGWSWDARRTPWWGHG